MKKFDENLSKKAKKMSLEECHAPTISSVIFIYAHTMVYINLQFTKVSVHFFSLFVAVRRWKIPKKCSKMTTLL